MVIDVCAYRYTHINTVWGCKIPHLRQVMARFHRARWLPARPARASCCPWQDQTLFLFSGAQGNLISALPVTRSVTGRWPGGEMWDFCEPAGEQAWGDSQGGSVAARGMCRLSPSLEKPGQCCWREGAPFGVPRL